MASQEVMNFIRGRKVPATLLTELKTSCLTLSKVLNDAKEREITDTTVKEVSHQNSNPVSTKLYGPQFSTIATKNWERLNLRGGFARKNRIRVQASSSQDSDSANRKSESESGNKNSLNSGPNRQKEKQGIVIFVMRLLRLGNPLPGSEPQTPTTFVSVPYSEFLSKINGNQVHKVEVDEVHIMFKLKSDPATSIPAQDIETSSSSGSSSIKLQEFESLLRTVAPTKRVVYTTTRPTDIKTPYEKMLENSVEFGSPDKRSGGFFNSAMGFKYTTDRGALHAFHRFHQVLTTMFDNHKGNLHHLD
nr:atp-dependent zinc metalloprotease ftsh 7, chloroplastic [Quercus suber]